MLCLSGFELYSRWVPLINQSIISTIKIFILNHRSKNSVVAIVIFIINRAFVPLLNDMASHTLPYAATSIRRTFLSKDTASLASQSAAFIFLRTLASELSTYHLASFIWQDQAVLLWQNTVKPLLNGTPPPPRNLSVCVVDVTHTIKTWTWLMKWNTYQGHEFEKNISLLYYSPFGGDLRSVVYVSLLQ